MSEVILFDLDGTITDSAEGITKCIQYALGHFGIEEQDLKKLECFVGPPLKEQFMKYGSLSEKQAETAISLYRERYVKTGIYENKLYEGIESVLRLLKARGRTLGIASSKPTVYVKQVLEYFELSQYFSVIVGAELDGTRTDKADVIEYALELLGMKDDRASVLMVGDRATDVEGALKCGMQCIGVAYGYGGIYELETAGAIYIAQTVEDLKILSGSSRSEGKNKIQATRNQIQHNVVQTGFWNKVWRVLYPLGIYYAIMVGVAIVTSLIFMALNGTWYGYDVETIMNVELEHPLLITSIAAVIVIPLFATMYRKDWRLRAKGLLGRRQGREYRFSIGAYLATVVLMVTASQVLNMLIVLLKLNEIFPYSAEHVSTTIVSEPPIVTTFLVIGIVIPVVQELVFRGLVFKRIQDYTGTIVGIILSGLLFGIYHENMVKFIYATILGWLLALIFSRIHNIGIPIVGHMVANFWSIMSQRVLPEIMPADTTMAYVILGILIAVAILSLIYICGRKANVSTDSH